MSKLFKVLIVGGLLIIFFTFLSVTLSNLFSTQINDSLLYFLKFMILPVGVFMHVSVFITCIKILANFFVSLILVMTGWMIFSKLT